MGDEYGSEFGQFIEDEYASNPEELAETSLRNEALARCLASLSERQRRVLELRYGLNGENSHTLSEIGRTFKLSRERIRQIEDLGLKKIRALADSEKLDDLA